MSENPDVFDAPAIVRRRSRRRAGAMWVAVALSGAAVVALLGAGRGDSAWSIGAAILIVSCIAVCSWAAFSAQRDIDEVVAEAKRFVAQREANSNSSANGRRSQSEVPR